MRENKSESILELLASFNSPDIALTKSALNHLNLDDLNEFYDFLTMPLIRHTKGISRPECPVKDMDHSSMARAPYKIGMAEYLAQWGYDFKNPVNITPSLFEATANYVETNAGKHN